MHKIIDEGDRCRVEDEMDTQAEREKRDVEFYRHKHEVYALGFFLSYSTDREILLEAQRDMGFHAARARELYLAGARLGWRDQEHGWRCPWNSPDKKQRNNARVNDVCKCPDWIGLARDAVARR